VGGGGKRKREDSQTSWLGGTSGKIKKGKRSWPLPRGERKKDQGENEPKQKLGREIMELAENAKDEVPNLYERIYRGSYGFSPGGKGAKEGVVRF